MIRRTPARIGAAYLAALLISTLSGWLALRNVDWSATWHALGATRYEWLVPALAALALWTWVRALRWWILFAPSTRPPLTVLTKATVLGIFFNNVLPARAGEAARVIAVHSYSGTSRAEAAATVVVDRVFDVLALLILLFALLPWLPHIAWVKTSAIVAVVAVAAVGGLFAAALIFERRSVLPPTTSTFRRLNSERLTEIGASLGRGLAVMRSVRQIVAEMICTLASWLLLGFAFWLLMIGSQLHLPLFAATLVAIAVGLSFIVPAAPGGLGVFEAAALAATHAYGLSTSTALAYVLILHAVTVLPYIPAGLLILVTSVARTRQTAGGQG